MSRVLGMDALNRGAIRSAVRFYSSVGDLEPGEKRALDDIAYHVRGKRILDLGVGGGRTVRALLELSQDYVGVDYLEEMVSACRHRFPGARFERMDARSMTELPDESFGLIVFSQQGISMVDHEGRMAILREAHRLLAPNGFFLFSTYNRNSVEHGQLFRFPPLDITSNLGRSLRNLAAFSWHTSWRVFNRIRYRKRGVSTPEYSIINDQCHDYGTMQYYITVGEQCRQLCKVGFNSDIRIYDYFGRCVEHDGNSMTDTFLCVARR